MKRAGLGANSTKQNSPRFLNEKKIKKKNSRKLKIWINLFKNCQRGQIKSWKKLSHKNDETIYGPFLRIVTGNVPIYPFDMVFHALFGPVFDLSISYLIEEVCLSNCRVWIWRSCNITNWALSIDDGLWHSDDKAVFGVRRVHIGSFFVYLIYKVYYMSFLVFHTKKLQYTTFF